jgi:hypothetical protein
VLEDTIVLHCPLGLEDTSYSEGGWRPFRLSPSYKDAPARLASLDRLSGLGRLVRLRTGIELRLYRSYGTTRAVLGPPGEAKARPI